MTLPDAVKIGSATYAVELVDELTDTNSKQRWGECDHVSQTIRVVRYAEPGLAWAIFLHEVLHAIAVVYDISLPERTISVLSDPLMTFFVTNGIVLIPPLTKEQAAARQRAIEHMNKTARNAPA
jgi:hypothetical protein